MPCFLTKSTVKSKSTTRRPGLCAVMLVAACTLSACDGDLEARNPTAAPPAPAPPTYCDDYVDVQWISRERSIGIAEYGRVDASGHARRVKALILLSGDRPKLDYKLALMKLPRVPGPSELIDVQSPTGREIIQTWDFHTGQQGDSIGFSKGGEYFSIEHVDAGGRTTLDAGQRSLCVHYPDGRRAWIAALPTARMRYGDGLEQKFTEAIRNIPKSDQMRPTLERFSDTGVIDVNHDGRFDYPSLGIYSYGDGYFLLRRKSDREQELDAFGTLVFEGNGAVCELDPPDAIYLVTDAMDVFLNRKCNLTQLSRKEK